MALRQLKDLVWQTGKQCVQGTFLPGLLGTGWETRQEFSDSLDLLGAKLHVPAGARSRCGKRPSRCGGSLVKPQRLFPDSLRIGGKAVEPGSVIRTDGWPSYSKLHDLGYGHEASVTGGDPSKTDKYSPRVHRVASLLKRWLLGTHQGAVEHKYLDYYLDEFTLRFNRRTSRSRGMLFTGCSSRRSQPPRPHARR